MDSNTSGESEPTKLDNKGTDVSKPVPEISNTEPYKPEPAKRTNSANKRPSSGTSSGIVNTKPVNNVAPQISITSNATSETEVDSKEDVNDEKKDEKNNEDSRELHPELHPGNDLDTLDPGGKMDDETTSNV